MADDSILDLDPGAYASGSNSGYVSLLPPETLVPSFTPQLTTLENQLPMDDPISENNGDSDSLLNLTLPSLDQTQSSLSPTLSTSSSSDFATTLETALPSNISSFLGNTANSLLNAFVTGPQNAQTQEQQALTGASITSALSSQIFGYLLIGLVIFLIFGFLEKEK
jgi:hypothetical protein